MNPQLKQRKGTWKHRALNHLRRMVDVSDSATILQNLHDLQRFGMGGERILQEIQAANLHPDVERDTIMVLTLLAAATVMHQKCCAAHDIVGGGYYLPPDLKLRSPNARTQTTYHEMLGLATRWRRKCDA